MRHLACAHCHGRNPYPRLNIWLAVLGVSLWLLSPVMVESGRLDPPLADTIFQAEVKR